MNHQDKGTGKSDRKQQGSRRKHGAKPGGIEDHRVAIEITEQLDREVERRLLELSKELKKFIRSEVRSRLERLAVQPKEDEPVEREDLRRERAELEKRLRSEMESRLQVIAEQRVQLDLNLVLQRFAQRAAELLAEVDPSASRGLSGQVSGVLRQAVLEAFRNRKQHLSHLTKIERVVREGDLDRLPQLLDEFFVEAGVKKISDPKHGAHFFKAENSPEGKLYLQVTEPAYVDEFTGKIIRAGRLKHVAEPPFLVGSGGETGERSTES